MLILIYKTSFTAKTLVVGERDPDPGPLSLFCAESAGMKSVEKCTSPALACIIKNIE